MLLKLYMEDTARPLSQSKATLFADRVHFALPGYLCYVYPKRGWNKSLTFQWTKNFPDEE